MISIRVLAAVALASSGLILSAPALAAPKAGPSAAPWANEIVLVGKRHGDRNWVTDGDSDKWRNDGQRGVDRRGDGIRRDDRRRMHDGDRDRPRHSDRDWRRDGGRGGDRFYGHDRDWRDYGHDRRRHDYGHDRGNHYGWYKQKHWRARHHPRHDYWVGRRFPRVEYVIIDHYDDYYLPPPRHGHYYARVDNDVYLIAEGTKLIIDAFVLFDAASR